MRRGRVSHEARGLKFTIVQPPHSSFSSRLSRGAWIKITLLRADAARRAD